MGCVTERVILAEDPSSVQAQWGWESPFNLLKLSAKSVGLLISFLGEESQLFTFNSLKAELRLVTGDRSPVLLVGLSNLTCRVPTSGLSCIKPMNKNLFIFSICFHMSLII